MRKTRLLLLVLALSFLMSPAARAEDLDLGVRAGFGFNDTDFDIALRNDPTATDKNNFVVGLAAEIHLVGGWAIETDALYTRRTTTYHPAAQGPLPAITTEYNLDFIEIPVNVRYQFKSGPLQPFVFLGANFGILVNATGDSNSGGPVLHESVDDQFTTMSAAAEGGVGLRYRLKSTGALMADVRYIYGLTDIASNSNDHWKIREVRVLAGFVFALE